MDFFNLPGWFFSASIVCRNSIAQCLLYKWAQPEGSPFSFIFFFANQGHRANKMLQSLHEFCLAQQQGLAESIFLRFLHPPPLLNYCSSPSMWCLDSTVSATAKWTQPLLDLSLHRRFGDIFQKAPEKREKVHFCDATSWNTVLLAQSSS